MTGNKAHLADYQEFKSGSVAFGGSNGRITCKGKIKGGRHMTGNKAHLADYQEFKSGSVAFGGSNGRITCKGKIKGGSFNLKNIDPSGDLACLFAKASIDESNKWHRRLGHKGKQHNASCKAKIVSSVNQPLQILHMDLFGPTSDEATPILKDFIRQAENQFNHKVKTIRIDNKTEFKNNELIEFCGLKGIKREYGNARTPQQNRVTERKNRTLIKVEAVNTACYVLNRVLVIKPKNKTPYELLTVENQANKSADPKEANNSAGTQANDDQSTNPEENDLHEEHYVLPICTPLSDAGPSRAFNDGELLYLDDPSMPHHEDIYASLSEWIFTDSSYDDEGVKAIGTKWVDRNKKDEKGVVVRNKARLVTQGHRQEEGIDYDEEKEANDTTRKEATHEIQNANTNITNLLNAVSTPISTADLRFGKKAIGTKWVDRNKKDEKGVVVRNKARLVTQGHRQEEGIDYDEVFAHVTPKTSHLQAVKRIFRYLKGQPKLGLWYPIVSSFNLEAYLDSDYAGANLDRKSTTRGCQFLGRRLISWQCKKNTIVATSPTEANYVAAAHCCR
nr:ribonuclease H-like domain-containing protein [Tanacetum cinerariifolium]